MSGTGLEQLMMDGEVCQPGTAKKDHGWRLLSNGLCPFSC